MFGRNEVSWEPGCRFEESPYHVIEHALPLDRVQADPDVTATGLKPDAAASDAAGPGRSGDGRKLVLITEYLELPTPANPRGTWVTMAAGKPIKPARDYPCWDLGGPVLHKLTYAIDPNSDRDLGLARFLLDHIRLMNDCRNKQAEWKNLALNPQVILQNVEMAQPLTDEPGAVYTAYGSGEVVWRPVPAIPQELEQMRQAAQDSIGRVSGQNDIPTQDAILIHACAVANFQIGQTHRFNQRLCRTRQAQVAGKHMGLDAILFFQLGRQLLQLVFTARHQHHVVVILGQQVGKLHAEPGRCAGDEGGTG